MLNLNTRTLCCRCQSRQFRLGLPLPLQLRLYLGLKSNRERRGFTQQSQSSRPRLQARTKPHLTLSSSKPSSSSQSSRSFSALSRPPPKYDGHVPLTRTEKGVLAVGSAVTALLDPRRHDMVALLSETTTPLPYLRHLRDTMLRSPTGRRILRHRPRITSSTLSVSYLSSLPASSFGAAYAAWLRRERVTPDTRLPVRHVDDEECAYVLQRYRETHDFLHVLTGLPVLVEGETAVKVLEYLGLGGRVPMAGVSVVGGLVRMGVGGLKGGIMSVGVGGMGDMGRIMEEQKRKRKRDNWGGLRRFWNVYGPWAVRNGLRMGKVGVGGQMGGKMDDSVHNGAKEGTADDKPRKGNININTDMANFLCVYWEEWMDKDIALLREHLGITVPSDMREMRRRDREARSRT